MKFLTIATEDELSEAIARKLVAQYTEFQVHQSLRRGGSGYLKSNLKNFFELASQVPVLLITDLDDSDCAPSLIRTWTNAINIAQPMNMLLRVAVREAEAWLLADNENFGPVLKCTNIPQDVESIADPKQTLLNLAKRAPRNVKNSILAQEGSLAIQGLEYNLFLSRFVRETWNPENAKQRSVSLNKTCERLTELNLRLQDK